MTPEQLDLLKTALPIAGLIVSNVVTAFLPSLTPATKRGLASIGRIVASVVASREVQAEVAKEVSPEVLALINAAVADAVAKIPAPIPAQPNSVQG
jgi:hypothetical protein